MARADLALAREYIADDGFTNAPARTATWQQRAPTSAPAA
jgi:hypothetical protein